MASAVGHGTHSLGCVASELMQAGSFFGALHTGAGPGRSCPQGHGSHSCMGHDGVAHDQVASAHDALQNTHESEKSYINTYMHTRTCTHTHAHTYTNGHTYKRHNTTQHNTTHHTTQLPTHTPHTTTTTTTTRLKKVCVSFCVTCLLVEPMRATMDVERDAGGGTGSARRRRERRLRSMLRL